MALTIEKRGYSSNPWRLLLNGQELSLPKQIDHPDIGMTVVAMPICGATRQQCTDAVLAVLEGFIKRDAIDRTVNPSESQEPLS